MAMDRPENWSAMPCGVPFPYLRPAGRPDGADGMTTGPVLSRPWLQGKSHGRWCGCTAVHYRRLRQRWRTRRR